MQQGSFIFYFRPVIGTKLLLILFRLACLQTICNTNIFVVFNENLNYNLLR